MREALNTQDGSGRDRPSMTDLEGRGSQGALLIYCKEAISNKCIASSNRCLTSSNKCLTSSIGLGLGLGTHRAPLPHSTGPRVRRRCSPKCARPWPL